MNDVTNTGGLVIEGLSVDYDGTRAVEELNLHVPDGATLAIVGPSGCGKSTVLRTIAGLIGASEGRVVLGGRDLTGVPASKRNIGLVPQHYALFPHLSVRGNIEYGLKARGVPAAQRRSRVDELLEFTELGALERRKPAQLSGGQRQRVALARAMAINPDVLLLDEPLAALDPQLRGGMRRQMLTLLDATTSVNVIVTHDRQEALAMADLVAVMRAGRLVQIGAPRELWARPADAFVADFLCDAALIDAVLTPEGVQALEGRWRIPSSTFDDVTPPAGDQPARLLLRPTALALSHGQPDPPAGSIEAHVRQAEFVGESTLAQLDLAGRTISAQTPVPVAAGDVVHVTIAQRRGVVLGEKEA
ncbi:ABC transporter ATP-binding protein [Sediminivirga luteola]|uniref:ABC-type quaternary amine transporter n=1 Tax=Sediminivirga luteola TaxID=1774748 RepID=A0A8J2U184_9MICO|nr:ABC transporter ATP-binding protein [Sediminivirga luteola]GGA27708.1 spermidine/putrescine ABC transporter ATPase [Sediminivirga luteola]